MNDRGRAKIKNIDGFLPLHLCIYARGYRQLIELLIDAYPPALKEPDPKGLLPIHIASRDETVLVDIIDMMVRCYPASIEVEDPIGDLPAHASIRNHLPTETTLCFLDHYPKAIDIPDKQGNMLLHMAIRFQGQLKLIEELSRRRPDAVRVKNHAGDLPMHRACLFNASLDVLRLLIAAYPEAIFERDAQGNLPIHLYYMQCRGGRPSEEMMHFFLEPYPASMSVRNTANCTPFEILNSYHEQLQAYTY